MRNFLLIIGTAIVTVGATLVVIAIVLFNLGIVSMSERGTQHEQYTIRDGVVIDEKHWIDVDSIEVGVDVKDSIIIGTSNR